VAIRDLHWFELEERFCWRSEDEPEGGRPQSKHQFRLDVTGSTRGLSGDQQLRMANPQDLRALRFQLEA